MAPVAFPASEAGGLSCAAVGCAAGFAVVAFPAPPAFFDCPLLIDSPTPSVGRPRHPRLRGHFRFSAKFICMRKQKDRLTATATATPSPGPHIAAAKIAPRARAQAGAPGRLPRGRRRATPAAPGSEVQGRCRVGSERPTLELPWSCPALHPGVELERKSDSMPCAYPAPDLPWARCAVASLPSSPAGSPGGTGAGWSPLPSSLSSLSCRFGVDGAQGAG